MQARLDLFYWLVICGLACGLLGAAFGAVVGRLQVKRRLPAGCGLGLAVVRAWSQAQSRPLSPGVAGLIVGATDGFAFLACCGGVVALLTQQSPLGHAVVLSRLITTIASLMIGAACFDRLACLLQRSV